MISATGPRGSAASSAIQSNVDELLLGASVGSLAFLVAVIAMFPWHYGLSALPAIH
jgi:hypothetical protein